MVNLFSSIPVPEVIKFLHNQSDGWGECSPPVPEVIKFLRDQSDDWGERPPPAANPVRPAVYNFDMDSKLFCDLVELCLSFNQFTANGCFYRQIKGLFMGSSISPPCAMMYLEHFETNIYEKEMPEHLKTTVWDRFVDDVFAIYRGSDDDFRDFFVLLNSFDPFIEFTCERSRTGVECGLGDEVMEALPFLDLVVTRHLDRRSNTLSNKLAIYRKPCHSGS